MISTSGGTCQLYFLPFVVKVDLFMRGNAPLDRSEFTRRIRVPISDDASLYAATAEDSVLRKLQGHLGAGSSAHLHAVRCRPGR